MGSIFRLINDTVLPAEGVRVVKAAEFTTLCSAQELIDLAKERARQIEAQAQEAYAQKEQEGQAQGLRNSQMEHAEKMYALALKSVESIENLESTIVNVVTEAVQRIIGDLPDDERIVRIVRTALDKVTTQEHIRVRIAVQDEKAVRTALASMLSTSPGSPAFLDLVVDPRLNAGACILESELGVLDASLEVQLQALEHAFAAKIRAHAAGEK